MRPVRFFKTGIEQRKQRFSDIEFTEAGDKIIGSAQDFRARR
jgi:hypothetical protein